MVKKFTFFLIFWRKKPNILAKIHIHQSFTNCNFITRPAFIVLVAGIYSFAWLYKSNYSYVWPGFKPIIFWNEWPRCYCFTIEVARNSLFISRRATDCCDHLWLWCNIYNNNVMHGKTVRDRLVLDIWIDCHKILKKEGQLNCKMMIYNVFGLERIFADKIKIFIL